MKSLFSIVLVFVLFVGSASALWAQATLSNEDIPKLVNSGLSETFILGLIDRQGSNLSSEPSRLVVLKNEGVSERLIAAVVKKSPAAEPITSDGVVQLVKAGFSENFVTDLLNRQPGRFAADANTVVALKQAGVSEGILATMIARGTTRELPSGTEISVRLIDAIDSERSKEGDEFRASLDEALMIDDDLIAPKGADA